MLASYEFSSIQIILHLGFNLKVLLILQILSDFSLKLWDEIIYEVPKHANFFTKIFFLCVDWHGLIWYEINSQTSFSPVLLQVQEIVTLHHLGKHS